MVKLNYIIHVFLYVYEFCRHVKSTMQIIDDAHNNNILHSRKVYFHNVIWKIICVNKIVLKKIEMHLSVIVKERKTNRMNYLKSILEFVVVYERNENKYNNWYSLCIESIQPPYKGRTQLNTSYFYIAYEMMKS